LIAPVDRLEVEQQATQVRGC